MVYFSKATLSLLSLSLFGEAQAEFLTAWPVESPTASFLDEWTAPPNVTASPVASPVESPSASPSSSWLVELPTASPVKLPTASPSSSDETPECADSPFLGIVGGKERTCKWVVKNAQKGRCSKAKFRHHCHESCDKCDNCDDSRLAFIYNGERMKCSSDVSSMCSDPDIAATCPRSCDTCWI